jgi:hypothetical protein
MAKKVTLKDKDDVVLYPKTVVDSVYDENGNSLEGLNTRFVKLPMQVEPYSIQTTMWWDTSGGNYHHITIPVKPGSVVSWQDRQTDFYCAFLTSYTTPVYAEEPSFVEGYEGRQIYNAPFTIPEGTKYLVVNNVNISGFTSIKIDDIEILGGIWDGVNNLIQDNKELFERTKTRNTNLICYTAEDQASKLVSSAQYPGSDLTVGVRFLIRMRRRNVADAVNLGLGYSAVKELYLNGERASSTNTWSTDDILDVIYDETNDRYNATIWSTSYRDTSIIREDDFTVSIVSNNVANKGTITNRMIDNLGIIRETDGSWQMISVDVEPEQSVTFGGFYLGRIGYCAFYTSDGRLIGTGPTQFQDPDGREHPATVTAPEGAAVLHIDVKSPLSPTNPYNYIQINYGSVFLTYDDFKSKLTEIRGYELAGSGDDADFSTIIEDLPVSDGTEIETGYAYIESSTGNIKVKL